jgi:serine/threonine protein phosphatase PrpC
MMLLPFMVMSTYALHDNENAQCFFLSSSASKLRTNQVERRTVTLQYAANNPIEDRYKATQLKNIGGFAVSVFDGHGGWQVAEFAMKMLHEELDRTLLENSNRYENQDDYV